MIKKMFNKPVNILFLNSLLFFGLFYCITPIYSIPIEVIPSQGLVYSIHVACECDYNLYVDGKKINPAGIVTNWDGTEDGVNVTNIFNPVLFEPKPKIIAFNNINNEYPGFMNGFVMDMNNGNDYTKHTDWKCKYFDPKENSIVPSNWMNYDYDDSEWKMAVSYGMNYQNNSYQIFDHERDGIHLNAEWLWTSVNSNPNIYCRKKSVNNEQYYIETKPVTTSAPSQTIQVGVDKTTLSPIHTTPSSIQEVLHASNTLSTYYPVVSPMPTSVEVHKTVVSPTPTSVEPHKTVVSPTHTSVKAHKTVVSPMPTTSVEAHKTVVSHMPTTSIEAHKTVVSSMPTTSVEPHKTVVSSMPNHIEAHKTVISPTHTSVEAHKTVISPTHTSVEAHKTVISPTHTSVEAHKTVVSHMPTTSVEPHKTVVSHIPTTSVEAHKTVVSSMPTTSVEAHKTVVSSMPTTSVEAHKTVVSPMPTSVEAHKTVVSPTSTSVEAHKTVVLPTPSKNKNNIIIYQHITYVIQKFKYTQKHSYSHMENLIRDLKYINQNHDLYKNLIYTRNHLHHHYNTIFKELYKLRKKFDANNYENFPYNDDDDENEQYKIPPFIQSMKILEKYIQEIEKSIQFIKGKYKYMLMNILTKLKLQYREDTIKLLRYWIDRFNYD